MTGSFWVYWSFTLFCRELDYDVFYAVLVLIVGAKFASVLFKSLFASLAITVLNTVHNAYIEQFKFLQVVCAWTYLKNLQRYTIEHSFFLAQTTRRKTGKFDFCESHTLNCQILSKIYTVLHNEPSSVARYP